MKEPEIQQNAARISAPEVKINTIQNAEVALETINNPYQTAKTSFDDLSKSKNDAQLQSDRDQDALGETIRVIDICQSAAIAG